MEIRAIRTAVFKEGDSLVAFVRARLKKIPDGSVLVIASKVVALAEGRTVKNPGSLQKERLIREESSRAKKTRYAWLTLKDGMVMANAGIDESNADGKLVLLPKDSFAAAKKLRNELMKLYRIGKLGVVVSDSALSPLRAGVTAHAVGYAGIKGIRDYRGGKDLFGRTLKLSRTNVVDSLATAAALCMGEGAERQPLALIAGAPVEFTGRVQKGETRMPAADDIFNTFPGTRKRR
jgi:coenzyme F420-0:L-glutamate ligase